MGGASSMDWSTFYRGLIRRLSVRSADAVVRCGHSASCFGIRKALDEALGGEEQPEHHDASCVSEVFDGSSIPHE